MCFVCSEEVFTARSFSKGTAVLYGGMQILIPVMGAEGYGVVHCVFEGVVLLLIRKPCKLFIFLLIWSETAH